jgi:AcrR family transcriptional regulator
MARKLDPEKRARFLSSALALFVANGVQQTSTAAIAKAAGTAAGTLFLYFPSKQDLINALVLEITEGYSECVKSQLQPGLPVHDVFFTIWEATLGWFTENLDAYHYILQVRHSGLLDAALIRETNKLLDYYHLAIHKGLEQGCIKSYPSEVIGEILYQDIVAVMNLISQQAEQARRDIYIQIGFEIFWDGIKL